MSQKLGRNDPCWCGSDRKLKKCHGFVPQRLPRTPLNVTPAHEPVAINTHHVSPNGKNWVACPGLLEAVLCTQPLGTIDSELMELRHSWGLQLENHDINELVHSLNDIQHKLRGVRYHRDNYERFEGTAVDRFRTNHAPPVGITVEESDPKLLFEIEGFLYQVKSTLDMLARILAASGLCSIGHSFGDHGDRILKQLNSIPQSCSIEAAELKNIIESAQPIWIDKVVSFRDEIAHKGMMEEFRCFVQKPFVGDSNVVVHFPEMPGGERVTTYIGCTESYLRSFADAIVRIAIRIAIKLQNEKPTIWGTV